IACAKSIQLKASRACIPSFIGYVAFTDTGGVVKLQDFSVVSALPFAARVPAGTFTTYVVAIGNLSSGLKISVFVPNHRHLPGGCGLSFTGMLVAASSGEVNATIGCENVMVNSGAIGTAPSGE